jgi:hypothetical protein
MPVPAFSQSDSMPGPVGGPVSMELTPVDGFTLASESAIDGRLVQVHRPVGEDVRDWTRQINVESRPIPAIVAADPAAFVVGVLEGFAESARADCHRFRTEEAGRSETEGAIAITCDGFDPVASDGRPSAENRYFHFRVVVRDRRVLILLYRWRSDAVSARSVATSDLPAREIVPTLDAIADALADRG